MDTTADTTHVSGGRHSFSQLSRLCHACQSVITRNDLEHDRKYPHHSDIQSFIEANRTNCYVCSYVFRSLGSRIEDLQEGLRIAAEEDTTLDVVVEGETQSTDDSDSLREVSLTNMRLAAYRGTWLQLAIGLNSPREGGFPLNRHIHDSPLRTMWDEVSGSLLFLQPFMIVPDQIFTAEFPTTLPSNTGSLETWSMVDSWIKTCSEQHSCLAQIDTKWYPTRLIERTSDDTFRIFRSDSMSQPSGAYITLSHRWGSSNFIRLTTDNLPGLERGSPVTMLPKTFREALIVAQRLNIRYIWIDSLCIVQSGDNGADWRREAAEMAKVYANSFCNISADYGDNQTHGLFFDRTPAFEPACIVHVRCQIPEYTYNDGSYFQAGFWDGDDISFKACPELREVTGGCLCHIMQPDAWFEDVLASPLNSRGWVVQERLLAPRVLHFLSGQVAWACGHRLAWEKANTGRVTPLTMEFSRMSRQMKRFSFDGHPNDHLAFWKEVVQLYSTCGMTQESDKLVAISGIAKRMVSLAKDQYVAGLWASRMPFSLGWKRFRLDFPDKRTVGQLERVKSPPPTGYYTPSFSWTAAVGPVDHMGLLGVPEEAGLVTAFIKHRKTPPCSAATKMSRPKINVEVLTGHIFGPLTSPVVEVQAQGILRTCHKVPQHLIPKHPSDDPDAPEYPRREPCHHYFVSSQGVDDPAIHLRVQNKIHFSVLFDRYGESKDAETDNATYYFTIYEWQYLDRSFMAEENKDRDPQPNDYVAAYGLLLKSVDPEMGRFKRVGHISAYRPPDDEVDLSTSDIGAPLGNERDLPAWSYDETTGEHVFYIV